LALSKSGSADNLRPGTRYEVFPYGIIDPEIDRIDVRFQGRG
jgi:hypothetical protein